MYGSVEIYDDMFGVHHGVIRARKAGDGIVLSAVMRG